MIAIVAIEQINKGSRPLASAETDVDVVVRDEQVGRATSIYKILYNRLNFYKYAVSCLVLKYGYRLKFNLR